MGQTSNPEFGTLWPDSESYEKSASVQSVTKDFGLARPEGKGVEDVFAIVRGSARLFEFLAFTFPAVSFTSCW
jgi:hypothetical protein